MDQIIKPYQGKEKYIFISYAHRDSKQVMPIISKLQSEGYRVWYDEGIDPGTEWDVNIARHIKSCGYMIAFLSRNYFSSRNCKDELNYARDLDKKVLLVYLEDITLPEGMDMRFGRNQSVFKHKYVTEYAFYDKLFEADGISVCLDKVKTEAASSVTNEYISIPTRSITTIKYDNGVYEGEVDENGNRHGKGKYTWASGSVYEGDFVNDKLTGKGKFTWSDGDIYEGDWNNDKREGHGKHTFADGSVYEGDWVDGLFEGKGKYTLDNGSVFEGNWTKGSFEGKGKYTGSTGLVYEGNFVSARLNGKGKCIQSDGTVLEGEFANNNLVTGTIYNTQGKIIAKYLNGVKTKI